MPMQAGSGCTAFVEVNDGHVFLDQVLGVAVGCARQPSPEGEEGSSLGVSYLMLPVRSSNLTRDDGRASSRDVSGAHHCFLSVGVILRAQVGVDRSAGLPVLGMRTSSLEGAFPHVQRRSRKTRVRDTKTTS